MKVLLQVKGVEKRYGSFTVLHDATAAIGEGMKVGVMGRNGAGKSTLCRILTGEEEPDAGEVIRARDLRLGYLAQHDPWEPGEAVLPFLMRHTGLEEWVCGRAAARFALKGEVLEKAVDALPGGFRTRVKLAAMIAEDPDFLILDEPTNFLDLSTLLLLQEFLAGYRGGALVVSHDREFLKRTCDHTLEVEHGELTLFPGDLEAWFEEKEVRMELAARTNAAVAAKKAQLQDFINRFGAKATKATQAKSKAKEMARLHSIEIRHPLPTARIRIPPVEERKGNAFVLEDLAIGYPGRRVAAGIHFTIERGARIAVVGDNGQGKTTFLRTLAGDLAPLQGTVKRGHAVEVAVYAQHVYENLDPEDTVLSHLEKGAPFAQTRQDALDMAGCFLFSGEAVNKKVEVLSGGERARLCLAGLLLQAKPVLLLDEPTNHLDFATVEALGAALREFNGTVLCISHDRTFVSMMEAEILEVDGGRVRMRAGEYGDYVDDLERRVRASIGAAPDGEKKEKKGAADWAEAKRLRSERAKARNGLKKAEERMRALEAERDRLAAAVRDHPSDAGRYRVLHEREIDLRKAEEEWLAAQALVERLGEG
ncbi:MAG: ABC-F family ATP-binding cassette domain-containing protein [Planctomycetaceae bacterium]|nr:ATP-binding cassette domain-containing protein [Planctomycetota bacterium]NUN53047.1 ABC-F family ATP-binding cassette domain-containing protein [Planctomycetaceae bacterium]